MDDLETQLNGNAAPTNHTRRTRPELLAPAGDWECARAAVENGADAIYFGLDRFNARMRADNFALADLPKLLDFLHRRGVKGYVTFNTLVFTDELAEAETYLRALIAAGVDAVLVQDVGICRLIRKLSPDLPIHASTQMTVSSVAGVEFARDLGCCRVVLARECGVKEIAQFPPSDCQIETFIHGALCVAYSGQCLTSEALGGRSANRGECAQACRMAYDLICDGQETPLDGRKYLLSPRDLAGLDVLPDLMNAGVASLKIEGRLKSPEYVANITRIYREALDRLEGEREPQTPVQRAQDRCDMEMAFSRGLYTGWLRGINHQKLVHARFGKKRGLYLGEVLKVDRELVWMRLEEALKPGDGVVFDAGHPEGQEQGGRVYALRTVDGLRGVKETALGFGHGDVDFNQIHAGDKVWKTSDPELDRRLRKTFVEGAPMFARPINLTVRGRVGEPLEVTAFDQGHSVSAHSVMPLVVAQKQPLTLDRLREQLGRLGGTPFRLGRLDAQLDGALMLPMSELNRLRRELADGLLVARSQPRSYTVTGYSLDLRQVNASAAKTPTATVPEPRLSALVRSMEQLDAAIDQGVPTVYCDFEDPKKYRDAVAAFRANPSAANCEIFVAPPRIFKQGEEWILKQVRSSEADGYLVRNYDHLKYFAGCRMIGDFSFNTANPLSAQYFIEKFGLERITASYDLNIDQLESLLKAAPSRWFEVTIHQHMPMFHMDHCVFCAFLSKGTDFTNCGRPCDKHVAQLRDRVGALHAVKADAGCRNTVFNARAQTGAEYAPQLLALGLRHFRAEFVDETLAETAQTLGRYQALLRGKITGAQVWRDLKLWNQLGVTRGPIKQQTRRDAGF
jgi:putative protease